MRNLWLFISKYNAFFLFSVFLITSLVILVSNSNYQKTWSSEVTDQIVGDTYEQINSFKNYIHLEDVNVSLAQENARLRNELKSSLLIDSVEKRTVKDSTTKQQYIYIVARVVNNSIHRENNYLTINRGKKHNIKKGMGVIGPSGIVGIVRNVSENFSRIQSVLHSESRFSASINGSIGSLVWGEDNVNAKFAILKDIPSHIKIKIGDPIITSGYSLFPAGIPIGKVHRLRLKGGNSLLDVEVELATDFSSLQYVYVINDILAREQQELEAQTQTP